MLECLLNEFIQSYCNKIVSQEMKNKFNQMLQSAARTHFKTTVKIDKIFSTVSGKLMKITKEDYLGIFKTGILQYER